LAEYCPLCSEKCDYMRELGYIFDEVKKSAYKIIEAKGATSYAIALSLVKITGTILRDENSVLPVSTLINDYCGINDVCLSIPSVVNRNGVQKFLRLRLSKDEEEKLKSSAEALKAIIKKIKV